MASVPRYLVERPRPIEEVPEQIKTVFQGIFDICDKLGIDRVTLVVPKKGGWENSVVAEFLGQRMAKALMKGDAVPLDQGGPYMTLATPQTVRNVTNPGLLVGTHISSSDMEKLDDSWDAKAILFIAWSEPEGRQWQATWSPEIIGPCTWTPAASTLSPAVVEALEKITNHINLGSGLAHPNDEAFAKRVMTRLCAEGHTFDPAEIKAWAQRNHWHSGAAADLQAVATKALRR